MPSILNAQNTIMKNLFSTAPNVKAITKKLTPFFQKLFLPSVYLEQTSDTISFALFTKKTLSSARNVKPPEHKLKSRMETNNLIDAFLPQALIPITIPTVWFMTLLSVALNAIQ